MSVVIIGGLDRLKRNYENLTNKMGIKVKVYSRKVPDLSQRINNLDGIVIFTGTVSHKMVKETVRTAKKNNIPIERSHVSSISGLKRCLVELQSN